jgi:protease-4
MPFNQTLTSLITRTKLCLAHPATHTAARWLALAALILATFYTALVLYGNWNDKWNGYGYSYCNVAVIRVYGEITGYPEGGEYVSTSADDILAQIRQAEADPDIIGMLLVIDSPGGYPAAAQSVSTAINNSTLWSMAQVRDQALSAGYMIASAADTVVASPFSDIGSIGVTMSYLEQTGYNEREGYRLVELASGTYKNAGSPDKPLTDAERALFERDLQYAHERFVDIVAINRGLERDKVARLADGSSMNAQLALENGLIDAISDDATRPQDWFAQQWETVPEDVVLCE